MSLSGTILAAAIAVSMPAATHPEFDLPRATITYGDLDLTTGAGQANLRARVASEINRMCSIDGPRDPMMSRLRSACVKTASKSEEIGIARAVASARQRGGSQLAAR